MTRAFRFLVPVVLFAVASPWRCPPRLAQGTLDRLLHVQEEWCQADGQRVREGHRHQGRRDAEGLGRDLAQLKAEARQPQGRRLVGRHRRSASAGGRGRPDRGLQVAEVERAARLGACDRPTQFEAARRSASTPARSASATTPSCWQKKKLPAPKCWTDLLKPDFKDEIQVANPNSSGTAYTMLATLVQLMGEDEAFDYLKALHTNVNQYTRSGIGADEGGGARRDHASASASCTTASPRRSPASR